MSSVESIKLFSSLSKENQNKVYEAMKKAIQEVVEINIPDTLEASCQLWLIGNFDKNNWILDCVLKHFEVYWCPSPDTVMPWENVPYEKDAPFCGLTWIIDNGQTVFEDLFFWFLKYENRNVKLPENIKLQDFYYDSVKARITSVVKKIDVSSLKEEDIGVKLSFEENKKMLTFPKISVYPKKSVPEDVVKKTKIRAKAYLAMLPFVKSFVNVQRFRNLKKKAIVVSNVKIAPVKAVDHIVVKPVTPFDVMGSDFVSKVAAKFLNFDHENGKKFAEIIANTFAKVLTA